MKVVITTNDSAEGFKGFSINNFAYDTEKIYSLKLFIEFCMLSPERIEKIELSRDGELLLTIIGR